MGKHTGTWGFEPLHIFIKQAKTLKMETYRYNSEKPNAMYKNCNMSLTHKFPFPLLVKQIYNENIFYQVPNDCTFL